MMIRARLWTIVIFWLAFVFLMSTANFSKEKTYPVIGPLIQVFSPGLHPHGIIKAHKLIRKAAHGLEYFVLGFLLLHAFNTPGARKRTWRSSLLALLGVLVWALSDEFHQSFYTSRQASMKDVAIDTMGGLSAIVLTTLWYGCRGRRFQERPAA